MKPASDPFRLWELRWPIFVCTGSIGACALMLVAALLLALYASSLRAANAESLLLATTKGVPVPQASSRGVETVIPDHTKFLDNLRGVFRLASDRRVGLGAVAYVFEVDSSNSFAIEHLSFTVEESYPALRSFLSELLRTPNLLIDAVQIEPGPAAGGKLKSTLSISLVYRHSPSTPASAPGRPAP